MDLFRQHSFREDDELVSQTEDVLIFELRKNLKWLERKVLHSSQEINHNSHSSESCELD